ncbi:MAG: hypothetical protein IJW64_00670 [Clostridia bacterium]|nr:hypothetical protein [Clostridia bacterium]
MDFYKCKLSPKLHKAYDDMIRSFRSMKFEVECQGLEPQELASVYGAILYDYPELFYMSQRSGVGQKMGFFGVTLKLKTSSIFTASQVGTYKIELEKIAKDFQRQTAVFKTDGEKIKYVCDFFLRNVKYEINNDYNQNCATALIQKKGQCSGIAKGVKYLLDNMGIDCIVVEGEAFANGQGGPHAWNIVWLEKKPYHLDVTTMIGSNQSKQEPFYYPCFLWSDDEMTSHTWDRNKYPKCDDKCPYKPENTQNGQGSTQSGRQNKQSQKPLFADKIIKFSIEMEKEIKTAIAKRADKLCFSTALSVEGQELLDEVSKTVRKVVKQSGIGLSFNVKVINGFNVEITFVF